MEFEKCALCRKTTNISVDTPVDKRIGYMEGVGQLCQDCFLDILDPGRVDRRENDALLLAALDLSRQ